MIALKKGIFFLLFLIKLITLFGQNTEVLQSSIEKDTIISNIIELEEVVVKGKRPVMKSENGNLILNVNKSYLKNFNKITSVFSHIPEVIVSPTGVISMYGKENLTFYINNVEVVSQNQIKSIKPKDIEKIEIIKQPGVEYAASADAIIKIYLRKNREDDFNVIINNNTSFGRKISNDINLSFFAQTDKISQYMTYSNDYSQFLKYDKSGTYSYFENQYYINQRETTWDDIYKNNNLFYSIDYAVDESNTLGFQFSGLINRGISNNYGILIIKRDDSLVGQKRLDNLEDEWKQLYNFNLNYEYKISANQLFSIISDYAFSNVELTNDVNEQNMDYTDKNQLRIISTGKYDIFSTNPFYRFSAKNKKAGFTIGSKYSFMKTLSDVNYIITDEMDYNNIKEHLGAFYAMGNVRFKSMNFRLGLRSEYSDWKVETEKNENKYGRTSWDFFPNVMIENKFSESVNITAIYRKGIKRPPFRMLNPKVIYRDSLFYVTGNPQLKPLITDMFALNLNIYSLYFSLGYDIDKNYIIMENINDKSNPGVIIGTYGNLDNKISSLNGSLAYSYDKDFFSGTANLSITQPFVKILFEDSPLELNKMSWMFQLSGNIDFTKTTSMNFAFRYNSKGNDGSNISTKSSTNNFTIGFNQYMFKEKLLISLTMNDIFHGSNPNWESYSNNVRYEMDSNQDSKMLIISLEYKFGKSDKTIRKKSVNTDNINRM